MDPTDLQPLLDLVANPAKPYFLIIAALIFLGYGIQQVDCLPNKWIPAILFFISAIVTPILTQLEPTLPLRVSITIGVLLGIVYAGVAWFIHNKVIKVLQDKFGSNSGRTDLRTLMVSCVGILVVGFFSMGMAGCPGKPGNPGGGSTDPAPQVIIPNPADNPQFVQQVNDVAGGLALVTEGTILFFRKSKDHVLEYCKMVSGSAHVWESLQTGDIPDDATVENAISGYYPTSAPDYATVIAGSMQAFQQVKDLIANRIPAGWKESEYVIYARYVNYAFTTVARKLYEVTDPYLISRGETP